MLAARRQKFGGAVYGSVRGCLGPNFANLEEFGVNTDSNTNSAVYMLRSSCVMATRLRTALKHDRLLQDECALACSVKAGKGRD